MIHLVTGRPQHYQYLKGSTEITLSNGNDFDSWFKNYKEPAIQLDTETNIVEGMYGWKGYLKGKNKDFHLEYDENGDRIPCKRECYVVQIGSYDGSTQWIFDIPELDDVSLNNMKTCLSSNIHKIIHNGLFDYTVIKWCFGIDINNVLDTYLASLLIHQGLKVGEVLPKGYHSLVGCASRILGIDLSKQEQTGFTGAPLYYEQIEYAAIDVTILGEIYKHMKIDIIQWGLSNVFMLENNVLRSYGDAMCENLYLSRDEWGKNMEIQFEQLHRVESEFYELLREFLSTELPKIYEFNKKLPELSLSINGSEYHELKAERAIYLKEVELIKDAIQWEDAYNFKWSSPLLKKKILRHIYPTLPEDASTVQDYKLFLNSLYEDENNTISTQILECLLNRDFTTIETILVNQHLEFLKEIEVYVPAGTVKMNLNSSQQKLAIFKRIKSNIKSVDKDVISKINHPLAKKLSEYNKAAKLATSYGQNFLDAIDPDGQFRVKGFSQILDTGRSSMKMFQLLPQSGPLYRNI